MSDYCQYGKCKAVAEYETALGNYCPYHYKVMKGKKAVKGKKIIITNAQRTLLQKSRMNPMFNVVIKSKGGKK